MVLLLLVLLVLAVVEIGWLGGQGRHRGPRQPVRVATEPPSVPRHRR
ncbi:hypothetical protein ACIRPK_32045 [Kitasatospora sp. NPDC101801]